MPDIKTALTTALEEGKRKFLTTTISDWDKQEQEIRQPQQEKTMQAEATTSTTTTITPKPHGMLSKDTFEYIKTNSGKVTVKQVMEDMNSNHSYNLGSVQAVITQLKGTGMIERQEDGTLVCHAAEYLPVTVEYKKLLKERHKLEEAERRARKVALLVKAREAKAAKAIKTKAAKAAEVKQAARGEYEAARAAREKTKTITVSATNGIAALQPAPVLPTLPTAESVLNNMSIIEARKLYDELKKLFN